MTSLKSEPPSWITSADQMLAVAHAMEVEAGRRYRELSGYMAEQQQQNLAELFDFLARIEDKHAEEIDSRARAILGKAVDPSQVQWQLPEYFDEEEARSHLLTPYRALAIAVRNEERAFAFYSYLAAHAENTRVRELAEQSARDELEHAALLRRERRKAWRQERHPATTEPGSIDELLTEVVRVESSSAIGHSRFAATLSAAGDPARAQIFERAAADERALAEEARTRLGSDARPVTVDVEVGTIHDALKLLEASFERYSGIAEHAHDEGVMNEAQALAERALRRLSYANGSLDNALIRHAVNGG